MPTDLGTEKSPTGRHNVCLHSRYDTRITYRLHIGHVGRTQQQHFSGGLLDPVSNFDERVVSVDKPRVLSMRHGTLRYTHTHRSLYLQQHVVRCINTHVIGCMCCVGILKIETKVRRKVSTNFKYFQNYKKLFKWKMSKACVF